MLYMNKFYVTLLLFSHNRNPLVSLKLLMCDFRKTIKFAVTVTQSIFTINNATFVSHYGFTRVYSCQIAFTYYVQQWQCVSCSITCRRVCRSRTGVVSCIPSFYMNTFYMGDFKDKRVFDVSPFPLWNIDFFQGHFNLYRIVILRNITSFKKGAYRGLFGPILAQIDSQILSRSAYFYKI